MENDKAILDTESGKYNLEHTRYWPEDVKAADNSPIQTPLSFVAHVNGAGKFEYKNGKPKFVAYTVDKDVTKQLDLMYAVAPNKTKGETGVVKLNFRHALSQVCFKGRNEMKNYDIKVKSVEIGNLKYFGHYNFSSTEETNENVVYHDDAATALVVPDNGHGTWKLSGDDVNYSVTIDEANQDIPHNMAEGKTVNLTCPGTNHENGFAKVLTLLPQKQSAWIPGQSDTYDGCYLRLNVEIDNLIDDEEGNKTVSGQAYNGNIVIPLKVDWKEGYRYIYTIIFSEGGIGGYIDDPSNPQPALVRVNAVVTVDDFYTVNEDINNVEVGEDENTEP